MTNEEAIEGIKQVLQIDPPKHIQEALEAGIKALEAQEELVSNLQKCVRDLDIAQKEAMGIRRYSGYQHRDQHSARAVVLNAKDVLKKMGLSEEQIHSWQTDIGAATKKSRGGMMDTEEEAKKKWCPMARTCYTDAREGSSVSNRTIGPDGNGSTYGARCLGSDCMMWRWETEICPEKQEIVNSNKGYCGLAGKPEVQ